MSLLCHFLKVEVVFEARPGFDESGRVIVMGGVRRRIFVLVLYKIEVAPHYEVGIRRQRLNQFVKLGDSRSRFVRIEVEVENVEGVGFVFRSEANTEGPPLQRRREGNNFLVVKVIQVWGEDDRHSSRGF